MCRHLHGVQDIAIGHSGALSSRNKGNAAPSVPVDKWTGSSAVLLSPDEAASVPRLNERPLLNYYKTDAEKICKNSHYTLYFENIKDLIAFKISFMSDVIEADLTVVGAIPSEHKHK